jgi:hypothetical protein
MVLKYTLLIEQVESLILFVNKISNSRDPDETGSLSQMVFIDSWLRKFEMKFSSIDQAVLC